MQTNEEKLTLIRKFQESGFWTNYLKPDLELQATTLESKVLRKEDISPEEREVMRLEAKAIRKMLEKPARDEQMLSKMIAASNQS